MGQIITPDLVAALVADTPRFIEEYRIAAEAYLQAKRKLLCGVIPLLEMAREEGHEIPDDAISRISESVTQIDEAKRLFKLKTVRRGRPPGQAKKGTQS